MDQIQKVLIKAGRNDLAQRYFNLVAADKLTPLLNNLKIKWRAFIKLDGSQYFTNVYESFTELQDYAKKNGWKKLLDDMENSFRISEDRLRDEINDEHGDYKFIRSLTMSGEKLENAYSDIRDIIEKIIKLK